jgi:glutaredoxin
MMVIVTPTCPYCAQAVLLENALAIQSKDKVSVEIVESYENADIARKYEVTGVPVTIVKKAQPLAIECVVRGYLAGSGWKEYQESRSV